MRVETGLFPFMARPSLWPPLVVITTGWIATFWFVGLYHKSSGRSRFEEFWLLVKAISVGTVVLFFFIFLDDAAAGNLSSRSRALIILYWAVMVLLLGGGRAGFRTLQFKLLSSGIGCAKTIIIGSAHNLEKALELARNVRRFPMLGYTIVGFVSTERAPVNGALHDMVQLGSVADLPNIIYEHAIDEILVALDTTDHEHLLEVIDVVETTGVGLKIVPDLYDIVSGQARTTQLYGIPLIDINPELQKPWEEHTKRVIDILASSLILLFGLPLWSALALLIKISSHGPVFFLQERVGREGKHFFIHKFRSMTIDAERHSGAVWAQKNDARVTWLGRILRKTHLDEVPQFWNVLKGEMSVVGPRPERPVFVEELSVKLPQYKRRLRVRPGITGWYQVMTDKYDETIDDVKERLRYDLFYIENMSFQMDLKIMLRTAYVMVRGSGQA